MENKSIGGALVEVFDAAFALVKTEINVITRRIGAIAKAKGLGVVLLLASLVPLTLALIFLILFVFYGLIRLGLGSWAAALLIGIVSLLVTGGLIFMGLKKLGDDVPDDNDPSKLSDIAKDDLKYGSTGTSSASASSTDRTDTPKVTPATEQGHTTGGHPVTVTPVTATSVTSGTATSARPAVHSDTGLKTEGHVAPVTTPQSTSTQGRPTDEHDGGKSEQAGIDVSTHPTYRDDMKKEGY